MSRSRFLLPWLVAGGAALAARLALEVDLLDDAFITLRAVRHFVSGEGLHFNPGADDHVLSTLAWPLLLALPRALGLDLVLATRLLGSVGELALLLAFGRYVSRLTGRAVAGPLAAIFLVGNPVVLFPSHGGMETALVLAAMVVALERELAGRPCAALAAAAAVVWLRFDGLLFFGVLLMRVLWSGWSTNAIGRKAGRSRWLAWRRQPTFSAAGRFESAPEVPARRLSTIVEALPGLGILAGWVAFSLWQFGTPVPSSVAAKVGEIGLGQDYLTRRTKQIEY